MSKSKIIKSVINLLANTAMHKLIANFTNKPESLAFLNSEIAEYKSQTTEKIKGVNLSIEDKNNIKHNSLRKLKKWLESYYPDVLIPFDEIEKYLNETFEEIVMAKQ